ncbi:MAG: iron-siderophore ABC transporter substrate-binding protein [Actinomycetota bacterium]
MSHPPTSGRRRRVFLGALGVAMALAFAACSSSDEPASEPPPTTEEQPTTTPTTAEPSEEPGAAASTTTAAPATTTSLRTEPLTVTDAFGNEVTVPAVPTRVFAGDDTSLANLLDLGVVPIGTAVNRNAVPAFLGDRLDGIVDLSADNGLGINIEAMAALEPDLIIGPGTTLLELQYGLASEVAPTYAYRYGYSSSEEIRTNLTDVAVVLGLEDRAAEILADLDARIADMRDRLANSDAADTTVSVVRIFRDGSGISLRHGTTESVMMNEIGVTRPPNQRSIEDFATSLSLETLDQADADVIFVYLDDPEDPAVYDEMRENPLWQTLGAVQNDRVYTVDGGVWNGISIAAAHLILDDLEATLGF